MKDDRTLYIEHPETGEEVEVVVVITSYGCGPTMPSWSYAGDPGEPPEWYVESIQVGDRPVTNQVWLPFWRGLLAELNRHRATMDNLEWIVLEAAITKAIEDEPEQVAPPECEPDYDDWRTY